MINNDESAGKIMSVEFSAIVHATEDPDKVTKAILNIIPFELRDSISFTRRSLEGHYGNPIVTLTLLTSREKIAKTIVEHLFRMISRSDLDELILNFEKSLDEDHNLYIRLDKQDAFNGKVKLTYEDPIRVKIKIKMWQPTIQKARNIFVNLGMIK